MTQKMYLGPTVPGLVKANTIFKDELPERVKKHAEEDKNFARLLVPMDNAMEARKELEVQGSVLAVAYTEIIRSL